MAIQTINIGNVVNDGLGDDLRSAFQKVNANFSELNTTLAVTASNVGTTGVGVFKQQTGNVLEFKNLISGTKISIDEHESSLTINCTQDDAFSTIVTETGIVHAYDDASVTIQGGTNINVTAANNVINVDTVLNLDQILLTYDFGPISGPYDNVVQLLLAASNIDFGTIDNPGSVGLDLGTL